MPYTLQVRVTVGRLIVAGVLVLVAGAGWLYRRVTQTFEDVYATWNAGEAVVYHLARTGEWPRSWEDLHVDFAEALHYRIESVEHIRSRVEIDFVVDPARLKAYPEWADDLRPPFRVIRARSGNRATLTEPNRLVWLYLNGKREPIEQPTMVPVGR